MKISLREICLVKRSHQSTRLLQYNVFKYDYGQTSIRDSTCDYHFLITYFLNNLRQTEQSANGK